MTHLGREGLLLGHELVVALRHGTLELVQLVLPSKSHHIGRCFIFCVAHARNSGSVNSFSRGWFETTPFPIQRVEGVTAKLPLGDP